jgi:orotidine-5'-phosphate decarboxylase
MCSTFLDRLRAAVRSQNSLLCIGLDPELARLPPSIDRSPRGALEFLRAIIGETADFACAYKPNLAFYEAFGPAGLDLLAETIALIPPGLIRLGDAKRGDIGNTARLYAVALFERLSFDAVTLNPYLGEDSVTPFLDDADYGVFILCRTSNPGAADFQSLPVVTPAGNQPLYLAVAARARSWNSRGNCGLVVGATAPEELGLVRAVAPDLPMLIPGIGAQGGDLAAAVAAHRPEYPAVISASRAILYGSDGADYAHAARAAAQQLRDAIERYRQE